MFHFKLQKVKETICGRITKLQAGHLKKITRDGSQGTPDPNIDATDTSIWRRQRDDFWIARIKRKLIN